MVGSAANIEGVVFGRPELKPIEFRVVESEYEKKIREDIAQKRKSAISKTVLGNRAIKPTAEQWRFLVSKYFPANQVDNALLVISKESGGDPNAKSPGNYGLFQINWVHSAKVGGDLNLLFDPEVNAMVARQVWGASGWKPFYAVCPRDWSNPYGIC